MAGFVSHKLRYVFIFSGVLLLICSQLINQMPKTLPDSVVMNTRSAKSQLEVYRDKWEARLSKRGDNESCNTVITLFTTFKDLPERIPIHNFIVKNWAALKPSVQPVLFAATTPSSPEHRNLTLLALQLGWDVLPVPAVNQYGTPLIRDMYLTVYKRYRSIMYGYANGDILFADNLVKSALKAWEFSLRAKGLPFVVGQRRDIPLPDSKDGIFLKLSDPDVVEKVSPSIPLAATTSIDYFLTARHGYPWHLLPDLVIGRSRFDNYLVIMALHFNLTTISASKTISALHLKGSGVSLTHRADDDQDADYNNNAIRRHGNVPPKFGGTHSCQYITMYSLQSHQISVFKHRSKPFRGDHSAVDIHVQNLTKNFHNSIMTHTTAL